MMAPRSGPREILDHVFRPRHVAVIGLSRGAVDSPVSILTTLRDYGYGGTVYIINPNMPPIDGYHVCPTIADLPEPVDLAVITVARAHVPGVLRDCAAKGIKAAIVITQGFADADEEGHRLQEEIVSFARSHGMRLLGPNTLGVSDATSGFTSSFIELHRDRTPIGQIAQSGLFMMGHHLINNEPAGFTIAADLGNSSDIGLVEVLDYFARQDNVSVLQVHLEGIVDGAGFLETAGRISREKPIVVLKAGRSETGRVAVASHSGAAAGENAVYQAAFRHSGVIPVSNAEELRMVSKAFVTYAPPRGRRVAVVSFSGGGAILAIDAIEGAGLTLASLSSATKAALRPHFPEWIGVENPVDIWIPVSRDFDTAFPAILDTVLADDGVDAVICIYCSYNLPKYDAFNSARHIGPIAARHPDKPILCWTYGLDITGFTRAIERDGNAMVFPSLEAASATLARLADYADVRARPARRPTVAPDGLDGARIAAILDAARDGGGAYLFTEALEILEAAGMPVAPWRLARDEGAIAAAGDAVGYPSCLKIVSSDIVHKSDSGGIRLGLADRAALLAGFHDMRAAIAVRAPDATIDGALVQRMAGKGQEVMLGARRDPVFGPVIVIGSTRRSSPTTRSVLRRSTRPGPKR
jgi:acyl-CoA synthetase (NDP forming)